MTDLQKQIDRLREVWLYWTEKENKTEFEQGYIRGLLYAIEMLESLKIEG